MNKFIFILFLISSGCVAQYEDINIEVKYMPFSMQTQVNFEESDFNGLSNVRNVVQVKTEKIVNDSVTSILINKLKRLKKDSIPKSEQYYDLRMRCKIISDSMDIDSFYIDNQRRLVYHGIVYKDKDSIVNEVISNLCKPIYTYYIMLEGKFWESSDECCNDSLEFISVFGQDAYKKVKEFSEDKLEKCLPPFE